ncbi:ferritin-like domain-containing protein [Lenzites betulinus]|nr:ferritin-like domain-containing protein [Lenzites betulinus]
MFPKATLLALAGAVATAVTAQSADVWSAKSLVQFVMNVENLESALFNQALGRFSVSDFTTAGFSNAAAIRGRFQQIADNEALHVAYLTRAIGTDDAPKPCTYDFSAGYDDLPTFINLAQQIESIAASAYIGLGSVLNNTGSLEDDQIRVALTGGASIAAAKARQAGWITATALGEQPWDGAFETPLTPNAAWSFLDPFVVSCPDTNVDLPLDGLPTLVVSNVTPAAGDTISLAVTLKAAKTTRYALWLDGVRAVYSVITDGKTVVPAGLSGTVYVGVVPTKDAADIQNFITGFAVVQFPFGPTARNVA